MTCAQIETLPSSARAQPRNSAWVVWGGREGIDRLFHSVAIHHIARVIVRATGDRASGYADGLLLHRSWRSGDYERQVVRAAGWVSVGYLLGRRALWVAHMRGRPRETPESIKYYCGRSPCLCLGPRSWSHTPS